MDLARAVGLSVQQVRNYEGWGFLPPAERGRNGYRLYTPMHLEALQTARRMIGGYGWPQALGILQALHRGELDAALALVDKRHAELDRQRGQVEQILAALRAGTGSPASWHRGRNLGGMRVGEAAKRVGVRVSAVRYWEQRGLLSPSRDDANRYRLYDDRQLQRLRVIVLLRAAGSDIDTIQAVLAEMAAGRPERALEAVERRRENLFRASRTGIEATAAFWSYASTFHAPGDTPA